MVGERHRERERERWGEHGLGLIRIELSLKCIPVCLCTRLVPKNFGCGLWLPSMSELVSTKTFTIFHGGIKATGGRLTKLPWPSPQTVFLICVLAYPLLVASSFVVTYIAEISLSIEHKILFHGCPLKGLEHHSVRGHYRGSKLSLEMLHSLFGKQRSF